VEEYVNMIPGQGDEKGWKDVCERDCEVERIETRSRTHVMRMELIRNRVSRNRFRSDGLARVCGPPWYYVGKLIILSIMSDLPRKSVTCPMVRARAAQELLSRSQSSGHYWRFFLSFLRADAVEIDAIS